MGKEAQKTVFKRAAAATCLLAATAGLALARELKRMKPHFGPRVAAGRTLVITDTDGEGEELRLLIVGKAVQSGTYLGERCFELPFEYYRAFNRAFDVGIRIHHALLIGGGGYAWPKAALLEHPELKLDVCESEPAITELARRWFYLDKLEELAKDRLTIFEFEGKRFLETSEKRYEIIINDAFNAFAPDESLTSKEGLILVHEHLCEGGLYLVNVVCGPDLSKLQELVACAEEQFLFVHVFLATDEVLSDDDNYLVICTDGNYHFEGDLLC